MELINYDTLLEKNAGIGLEKQFSLGVVIGDRDWLIDTDRGTITFGDDIEMQMQILGSYSHQTETWLWIWANESTGYSAEITTQAKQLKALGENYNVEFLIKPEYKIEPTDIHALGMIASGELGASAYYAGDYGDGIALFLLKSDDIDQVEYNEQERILSTFPQIIQLFTMNHKRALINYMEQKKYTFKDNGNELIFSKNENIIEAVFDKHQRLSSLNGKIIK